MTNDELEETRPSEAQEVVHLVQRIAEAGELPPEVAESPTDFFRRLRAVWIENGGEVAGKLRNSQRQIVELLDEGGESIASLQPKLAGKTRITRQDTEKLTNLFLTCWQYIGDANKKDSGRTEYSPMEGIDIHDASSKIVEIIFPKNSAEYSNGLYLPQEDQSGNIISLVDNKKLIYELFLQSDTLITISEYNSIIAPNPIKGIYSIRNTIDTLWKMSLDNQKDSNLVWIVDIGGRSFNDEYSISAFYNVDYLAAQFRALGLFQDEAADERWHWLQSHAAFVVGSLQLEEIDNWYQDEKSGVFSQKTRWPSIEAQHALISAVPSEWARAPELRKLYGQRLDDLSTHSFTVFYREEGWSDVKSSSPGGKQKLRYFANGPSHENWNQDWALLAERGAAKSIELSSPGQRYGDSLLIVCAATGHRLGRHHTTLTKNIDPNEALAHLRLRGFAVLKLDEFLSLNSYLSTNLTRK